jgi:hypothetical protein
MTPCLCYRGPVYISTTNKQGGRLHGLDWEGMVRAAALDVKTGLSGSELDKVVSAIANGDVGPGAPCFRVHCVV